jgi:hypothetical protein
MGPRADDQRWPRPFAARVCAWYVANLVFNVGMKRSHALLPDVMLLTTLQLLAGALALAVAVGVGAVQLEPGWWSLRRPLALSTALILGGTLATNVSLTLLSVSFTHVVRPGHARARGRAARN